MRSSNWFVALGILIYLLGLLLSVGICQVAAQNDKFDDDLAEQFTQLFKQAYLPGASVAVLRGGKIVHSQVYGDANRTDGRQVRPGTLFEAASLSKAVFAPIVLQLVEEGKLQLDRPLYRFFDKPLPEHEDYQDFAEDERYKQLTARIVLSHTTGLPNWRSNNDGKLSFRSDPGEAFTYSGEGFQLLQLAVEGITGKSLETLAQERIFGPLGMQSSSYLMTEAQTETSAHGHSILGIANGKRPNSPGFSAWSLHSNANEYARFIQAIIRNELLNDASHRILLSPQSQQLKNEERPFTTRWGLGIAVHIQDGKTWFWHSGSNRYFKALALAELTTGDGVVFFANSDLGEYIFPELVDIAVPDFGLSQDFMSAAFSDRRFSNALKLALALTDMPYKKATAPFRSDNGQLTIEPQKLSDMAIELAASGMYEAARLLVKESVRQFHDNAHVHYADGVLKIRQGQTKEAKVSMQKALALNPELEQAQRVMAALELVEAGGDTTFALEGYNDASSVMLAGTFNDWHPMSIPLQKTAKGWQVNITLPSGEHFYKFIVDGNWIFDPNNPQRAEYGGYMNSLLKVD